MELLSFGRRALGYECGISEVTKGLYASVGGRHARLDLAPLEHLKVKLQFFPRTRTNVAPGEQSSEANARVYPKLAEHHDTSGSITRLMASTIRRQPEIFTATCLRPRGVSL
jgi:hypothetical protein